MTKRERVKKIAEVIKEETGLTAPVKNIHIIESYDYVSGDAQFIKCEINGHIYQWDGYTLAHIAPWNMAEEGGTDNE